MTREGKVNPRLKGALDKWEFAEEYYEYIRGVDDNPFLFPSLVDTLYNEYLEAYKYDEGDYKKWLERRDK